MISKQSRLALDELHGPLLVLDDAGCLIHVDLLFAQLLGCTPAELHGRPLHAIVSPPATDIDPILQQFSRSNDWVIGHFNLSSASGDVIAFPCQGKVLQPAQEGQGTLQVIRRYAHPGFAHLNARIRDLDSEQRQRHETEMRLQLISYALDHASDEMYWLTPDGIILMVNEQVCRALGYRREELQGQSVALIDPDVIIERMPIEVATLKKRGSVHFERTHRRKDGTLLPVSVAANYLCFNGNELIFGIARDISERKKSEQTINELIFYDRLTGLPNRTLLIDRLRQAINAAHRDRTACALLLTDLDHFKTLNDVHGHDLGDQLLKQVGTQLSACVREGDSVARLGGDEFIALLTGLPAAANEAAALAESVAQQMLERLAQPYLLGELAHHGSASIGITCFDGRHDMASNGIDDLLKQVELAMYQAKAAGRNTLSFFDPSLESAIHERAALEHDLRLALGTNQFQLYYQPQMIQNQLVGVEALVRWQHPQRGMVSPAEFIPLAEDTGLILPLGQWVLTTACHQLKAWADQTHLQHLTIAVNVSARQFHQPDFVDQVLAALTTTAADPQRLKLELTESLLVENVETVVTKMTSLKAHGIGFSLDDFGTGYSSLSYLKRLPLDQLKIDQSFVRDVLTDPSDASIARTIIALAKNLGLGVIAEGVETAAQRDFLASSGCLAYQGYLFSRPLPAAEFEDYARRV
jgi:diguanylate cyclase (GGDEF)-like protein/PAS domain S-box-containing protein